MRKKYSKLSKCKSDNTGIFFWQHKINAEREKIVTIRKTPSNGNNIQQSSSGIICLAKFASN